MPMYRSPPKWERRSGACSLDRRLPRSSIFPNSAAMRRAGSSWSPLPRQSTRRMNNRCIWCSMRRICGHRSGRSKAGRACSAISRRSCGRGRVRGFIPWLITQRPAVIHKDVLSQADILIAMKLTSSQDREAIGAWIEGQADRQEGRRILAELPRLRQGEGYLWAPGHGLLERIKFPAIRTLDSSRTPRRGDQPASSQTLAEIDLNAISAALAAASTPDPDKPAPADGRRLADL